MSFGQESNRSSSLNTTKLFDDLEDAQEEYIYHQKQALQAILEANEHLQKLKEYDSVIKEIKQYIGGICKKNLT